MSCPVVFGREAAARSDVPQSERADAAVVVQEAEKNSNGMI